MSSPAMADIDGDGYLEVVVGTRDQQIYSFNAKDGILEWRVRVDKEILSSPVMGDLNGDSIKELIITCVDKKVYCLEGSKGRELWTYSVKGPLVSSGALFDMNGDGFIDVVVGSKDKNVYTINSFTGELLWKFETDGEITSPPVIADVDGDGGMDVLITSRDKFFYAIDGWDMEKKKGGKLLWKEEFTYYSDSSPCILDVDRDGYLEIFITSANGRLYSYKTNYAGQLGWPRFGADPFNTGLYENTRSYVQAIAKGVQTMTSWWPVVKKP